MADGGPLTGAQEIERLYVVVESDISKLIVETKDGVHEVETGLRDMGDEGEKQTDRVSKGFSAWAGVLQGVVIGAITAVTTMAIQMGVRLVGAIRGFFQESVAIGAQFETFGTQFETLLGSAEAAQKRIVELAEFGRLTPFELPEVVQASRMLQVFGGEALSTGESLKLVGDTAAGVNRPFQEIAFWFGRMYDALQSGRPFGEAALRLQELGILAGGTRAELEKMQKSGVTGAEVWARFAEVTGERFSGNMERLSATLQGIQSNLADFVVHIQRVGGQPVFDEAKESAQRLLDLLEERRPEIEEMAVMIGTFIADIQRFFHTAIYGTLETIQAEDVQDILDSFREIGINIQTIIELLSGTDIGELGFIGLLKGAVAGVNDALDEFILRIHEIEAWTARRQAEAASLEEQGRGISIGPLRIATGNEQSRAAGQKAYNEVMERYNELVAERDRKVAEATKAEEDLADATEDTTDSVKDQAEAVAEELDPALEKLLDKVNMAFIDAQFENEERRQELAKDHQEKMADIEEQGADARLAINRKLEEALTALAGEVAKRRQEAIDQAAEDHARVDADAAKQRASMQDDYEKQAERRAEDHQREMLRINLRYLDDVQDAVRARDARRLQELREQHGREVQQREEDYRTTQDRARQDYQERMDQLAANVREQHAAIDQGLQEELAKIEQYAIEREAQLRAENAKELAALDEKLAEQRTKENESYAQRQQALQVAMQKRLQTVAMGLSDEQRLNAEGARRILETLNKTFGIGGDIDRMMDQFARRRRQKIIVETRVERAALGEGPDSSLWQPTTIPSWKRASMQHGGSMYASSPTMVMFGEAGPERAVFTPLGRDGGTPGKQQIDLRISGSAPPGIGPNEVDRIAGVLLGAIKETGAMR